MYRFFLEETVLFIKYFVSIAIIIKNIFVIINFIIMNTTVKEFNKGIAQKFNLHN